MPRIYGEPLNPKKAAQALAGIPLLQGAPVSDDALLLYVHVPFCERRCHYCAFHSQTFNQITFDWYLKTLLAEIDLWGRRLKRPKAQTVYFGGGTPSLVPLAQLDRVVGALRKGFDIQPDAELTIEANPSTAQDVSFYRGLLSMGFNRLSLGMQSLADEDLIRLGRPHSAAQAVEAFGLARSAGFANISIDLIWGLPQQKLKHWLEQLRVALRMKPDHLSCYGLSVEPHTPLGRMAEEVDLEIAPESELGKMFIYGAEYLESEGYLQYEISNFARMGFKSRHNAGYWKGLDYLGMGPSAVSTLGQRRFSMPRYMDEYDAAVRGQFAGLDFEVLDKPTRAREYAMLRLRTADGMSLKRYRELSGVDLLKHKQKAVEALYQNGLIRINKGRLRLTKNGMLVSNTIIRRLAFEQAKD